MVNFALEHEQVVSLIQKSKDAGGKWRINAVIWEIEYFLIRRISEVLELQVPHILWDRNEILFLRTKTGDVHMKVNESIMQDLRDVCGKRKTGYVFHSRATTPVNRLYGKPLEEMHIGRQLINRELREACERFLGIHSYLGLRTIKQCDDCPGKSGVKCTFNKMRWRQLVPTKKCFREGRPSKEIKQHLVHSHILRASAATTLIEMGFSEMQVMAWGHWVSRNAFRQYLVLKKNEQLLEAWETVDTVDERNISISDVFAEIILLRSEIRKMKNSEIQLSDAWGRIPGQMQLQI